MNAPSVMTVPSLDAVLLRETIDGVAVLTLNRPAARNAMAFPWLARDGLEPHSVRRLYLCWSNRPTVAVDTGATLERKLAALRAHASQIREPERLEPRIRGWAQEEGAAIGAEAAESFRVIVIEEDPSEAEAFPEADTTASLT